MRTYRNTKLNLDAVLWHDWKEEFLIKIKKQLTKFENTTTTMTPTPDLLGQALQFRVAMSQPIGKATEEELRNAFALIHEEFEEFWEAHIDMIHHKKYQYSKENALKELSDLVYVCFQYATLIGWELDEACARVHRSNMSKLVDGKPIKNDKGKVLKGPNYKQPYLEDLI